MSHKRNDETAVRARRQKALDRWTASALDGYRHLTRHGGMSDGSFVDKQISILRVKLTR